MSAAPRPKTEEQPVEAGSGGPSSGPGATPLTAEAVAAEAAAGAAAAEAEGWALLDGLRRRMDEHANQNRKTQTEVRQLADSIGALVAEQRKRSRWLNVNSFVAYVMFTLLCGGAFYLLYQSRARELVGERNRVIGERDAAVRRADEAITKATAREAADTKAWDAYALLEGGKREAAAKKLAELSPAPLSKLDRMILDTRAKQAEVMQVDTALKGAVASFKAGHFSDVVTPLETALPLEPTGPRAAQMHYYLGVAYAKAGSLDAAITHLEAAVAADVDVEDARFHLASALDRAGQWGKAKIEYQRFATAHPMSSYAAFAMRRGATLDRMPLVAPNKPAAAAGAGAPTIDGSAAPPSPPGISPAVVQPKALGASPTVVQPKPPGAPAPTPAPGTAPASGAPASKPAAPIAPATPLAKPVTPKPAAPKPAAKSATEPQPAPKTLDFNDPSSE